MEKSKKQEKLSDNSTRTCACDINNVSEKDKADFETICNFADKFVSSQKDMSAEIADIVDKHFWEML
jgi:hypothetical protein